MKNIYKIEYWRFHQCRQREVFTNKRKAQKWLRESGWWIDFDMGDCMIYIYKNEEEINFVKDKGWRSAY